jgi:DMSO reductase family type II enzyme chaperone
MTAPRSSDAPAPTALPLAPDGATERAVHEQLARASVYRLLGRGFAYPIPDDWTALARMARAVGETAPSGVAEPLARLAESAERALAADVAAEYVFLFDRGARCPPYEGAWSDAPGLAGKAALLADVAGFYQAFGLVPAGAQPDAEDHIAAECEFMSALALKEAWAVASGNDEAAEVIRTAEQWFLADHLGRWTNAFAATLREATPVFFYTALADLLAAWVAMDSAALGAVPRRLDGLPSRDPVQDEEAFTCPMNPVLPNDDGQEGS